MVRIRNISDSDSEHKLYIVFYRIMRSPTCVIGSAVPVLTSTWFMISWYHDQKLLLRSRFLPILFLLLFGERWKKADKMRRYHLIFIPKSFVIVIVTNLIISSKNFMIQYWNSDWSWFPPKHFVNWREFLTFNPFSDWKNFK